jgi:pSer/pThr/pTyr-binding forkhead associated (FHA) protein
MERSPKVPVARQLALRFIAGKYKGSELLLEDGQEIMVGRYGDVDLVLAEDMVSRQHARIALDDGRILIEDLGSTNGTFVNGEKIRKEVLKEGDRILIGTNILKVVAVDPAAPTASKPGAEIPQPMNVLEQTRALSGEAESSASSTMSDVNATMTARAEDAPSSVRSRAGTGRSMSGAIDEFPLPYLLQLLESSQKSGLLVVRSDDEGVAKIYLRKGIVKYASMVDMEELPPLKVVYRVLAWMRGTFDLESNEERTFPTEINASMHELLMEGLHQIDELNNLRGRLPEPSARLILVRPLKAPLRDLAPGDLDVLQIAINHGLLSAILNKSPASDLETARAVLRLMDGGYLRVG